MGRPPLLHPASEIVKMRVTLKMKRKLISLARAAGMTLSAYMIACGLGGLK